MAKGLEKHKARQAAAALHGKDLARRARRKCELCSGSDDLRPHDCEPNQEPSLETLALLCQRCRAVVGGRKDDPRTLRFLETAIWSDVPPVSATARRMLAEVDADWARAALDLVS